MQTYYLYQLHANGRFSARDVIEAEDDQQAIALAEQAPGDRAMELWRGTVMVKAIPPRPRD